MLHSPTWSSQGLLLVDVPSAFNTIPPQKKRCVETNRPSCSASHHNSTIVKFADDTTIVRFNSRRWISLPWWSREAGSGLTVIPEASLAWMLLAANEEMIARLCVKSLVHYLFPLYLLFIFYYLFMHQGLLSILLHFCKDSKDSIF